MNKLSTTNRTPEKGVKKVQIFLNRKKKLYVSLSDKRKKNTDQKNSKSKSKKKIKLVNNNLK